MVSRIPNPSKSASKLLLLILLGAFCTQTLSIRISSNSESLSSSSSSSDTSSYVLSSIFPSSINLGCVNINNLTTSGNVGYGFFEFALYNPITASIFSNTVSPILTALVSSSLTSDVASSDACLGNFAGSYITGSISDCSSMLLPSSSEYSVLSFNIPLPGGVCAAEPKLTTASFCLAMGEYNSLPSVSIQANAGTLSCLATAAGSGLGYVISTAISAGLDTVGVGISLTSSFVKNATLFTGSIQTVEINGNYYDYISFDINTTKYGLPDIFELTGSATRVISVFDDASTWVSELSSASKFEDAITLFESFSMLISIELDLTLSFAEKTLGVFPDLGPYTLGLANLYATTTSSTLASGQTLGAGVYVYVASNNILEEVISDIVSTFVNTIGGTLNTILSSFGINITSILDKLTPSASSSSNAFGFLINTSEISFIVQTSLPAIPTILPSGGPITLQCYYNYSSNQFSCQLNLGTINKFLTALLSGAVWVIKEASAFFDQTGTAIAFVEQSLGAFTDKALQTTAKAIQSGALTVSGYATQAATWASTAIYQCGYQTVTSAVECGTSTVTSAAECGTSYVTSAADCGTTTVTSAAECGTSYVTSGAECGYDTISGCLEDIFSGKSCKKAASCNVAKTCSVAASCNMPKTCTITNSCKVANSC